MRFVLLLLPVLLLLSGCAQRDESQEEREFQAYVQKTIPPDKDATARRFIECIVNGDIAHAQEMAGSSLQIASAKELFQRLHTLIPQGRLLDLAAIGYRGDRKTTYNGQAISYDSLTYQLHFQGRWYLANITVENSPEPNAVAGIEFNYFNGYESPVAFNRFSFAGRGWSDWTALILCIGTPIFCLATAAICAMSPVRRRWLWILFIAFGMVQFRYDWTHATVEVRPISILLLGGGYLRENIYSPLILQWAIPVGAFTFLILRRKLFETKSGSARKTSTKRTSR